MRGESDCATGCPSRATCRVLAIAVLGEELVVGASTRGEEVVPVILLARVVEVVDMRGMGGGPDRRKTRIGDRRRRQAEMHARVVRRGVLQLRLMNRLGR